MTFIHKLEPSGPWDPEWKYEDPHKCTPQDTYGLHLYKIGPDWAFNMFKHGKIDELLTCGTEKALDYWYWMLTKEEANWTSEMYCTISTKPIEDATCTLDLIGEHPEKANSHDYIEPISGEKCWLCEYGTQMGIGGATKLWLKLTLENG